MKNTTKLELEFRMELLVSRTWVVVEDSVCEMFHENIHHVAETSLHFMQKTSWLMFSAGLS